MHSSSVDCGTRTTGLEGSEESKNARRGARMETPLALYAYMAPMYCAEFKTEQEIERKSAMVVPV